MSDLVVWNNEIANIVPAGAVSPSEITDCAVQLSGKDKAQLKSAFENGHYEMALQFLWGKTVSSLKKELATVGIGLIGEMLGKVDIDEDSDIDEILTSKEAIRLAEELGIVTSTDGMRLRHTYELITHFSQMEIQDGEMEEIDVAEAIGALKACVKSILGRPKIEVAKKFVDFRDTLRDKTLGKDDPFIEMLRRSPYFFLRLTISVLMTNTKKFTGANLEHTLANINVVLPEIWPSLRDKEKWQIGHSYAEAYADGRTTVIGGLKSALLKVKGFDFVPENLRSDTFIKAADALIKAHEGLNNFYTEAAHIGTLMKMGSIIPIPAVPACTSALLCVVLGNHYGVAWSARDLAYDALSKHTPDRWEYYLNSVLSTDVRILQKLNDEKPAANWLEVVNKFGLSSLTIKDKIIGKLIELSARGDASKVIACSKEIINKYYQNNK